MENREEKYLRKSESMNYNFKFNKQGKRAILKRIKIILTITMKRKEQY